MIYRISHLCSCIIDFIKLVAKKGDRILSQPHISSLFLCLFMIMDHCVVSDLGLHCMHMSHKKNAVAGLIWVNGRLVFLNRLNAALK